MSLTGSGWLHLVFFLLCARGLCKAERYPCAVSSSAGSTVPMGSTFKIYCVFKQEHVWIEILLNGSKTQSQKKSNSTTFFVTVKNITKNSTFTCKARSEICGIDITPGYPPDVPQNLTCVQKGELGNVTCSWRAGRETHLPTTAQLWVGTHDVSEKPVAPRPGSHSATFSVSEGSSWFSAWVRASNGLGSANSTRLNRTLSDIVKPLPPNITRVQCSSRACWLQQNAVNSQLLQVQHRAGDGNWTSLSFQVVNATGLQPNTRYEFQARSRPGADRGLWSDWSRTVESSTDEEAPAKQVDVWYIEESTQASNKLFTVLWKNLSQSEARGRIEGYQLVVWDLGRAVTTTTAASVSSWSLACSQCAISLTAFNSKGHSPAAKITIPLLPGQPPWNVSYKRLGNHNVAISWREPAGARAQPVSGYLVEWQSAGQQQDLHWDRVGSKHLKTHTIGIQPYKCYKGAVYALYAHGRGKAGFVDVYTRQSAPEQGPAIQPPLAVVDGSVTVRWVEIPPERRRGCLQKYTIYMRSGEGEIHPHDVMNVSQVQHTISGLRLGETYSLWMTGWTHAGQGPAGERISFHTSTPSENLQMAAVFAAGFITFLCCLLCLCLSSVCRRAPSCCCCLVLNVPDPANSKWAKECTTNKGKVTLLLYLSESSTSEEEEPDTVEVQEVLKEAPTPGDPEGSYLHVPATLYAPATLASTAYIKSFSHESQASAVTGFTVDYISTHGALSGGEDEEEEEEESMDVLGFYPCPQSPFLGPLAAFGGKLTLDAVKIDCSGFLEL